MPAQQVEEGLVAAPDGAAAARPQPIIPAAFLRTTFVERPARPGNFDPFRSLPQLPGAHPTISSCDRKILLAFVVASIHVPV
jgi:hypothetical protein